MKKSIPHDVVLDALAHGLIPKDHPAVAKAEAVVQRARRVLDNIDRGVITEENAVLYLQGELAMTETEAEEFINPEDPLPDRDSEPDSARRDVMDDVRVCNRCFEVHDLAMPCPERVADD